MIHVEEMGLFDPCGGDGVIFVQVEEMGLFGPCGGDGVI